MGEERKPEPGKRFCPYCDAEIAEASFPYCEACKITTFNCPKCHKPVLRDNRVCPHCGTEIKG